MKLTLEHIDRTINNLDRLMPARLNRKSTREYSLKEGIFLIAPKLMEKREMGCTTHELVKALADDGIVIKAATLNHYLCEYQKQAQEKNKSGPTTEANPEHTSSTKANQAARGNPKQTSSAIAEQTTGPKPNPAVGASPRQASNTKLNLANGENAKPTTGPESVSAAATKSEQTTAWDKPATTGQSANRPDPPTWQSEKGGDDD